MNKILFTLSMIAVSGMIACESWDYEEVDFLEVNTISLSKLSSNSIQLIGSIEEPVNEGIGDQYGFCWSLVDQVPVMDSPNTVCEPIIDFDPTVEFRDTLVGLPFDTILNVRAFSYWRNKLYYGEVKSIRTGRIELTVNEATVVDFKTVRVEGTLLGVGQGIDSVIQHGHYWSVDEITPAIDCSTCEHSTLGPRIEDGFFVSNLENLETGQEYFVWSYAIYMDTTGEEKPYFSSSAQSFQINDVWVPRDRLPQERYGAVSFTINDNGYVGLGYNRSVRFIPGNNAVVSLAPVNNFYQYSFSGDQWSPAADIDWVPQVDKGRLHAVSFVVDGKAYVGTGYAPPLSLGTEEEYYNDFWVFNGQSWSPQPISFPGAARFGAVAFSLNGKGYVGLGKDESGAVLDDFWEFDPHASEWDSISGFPGMARWGATSVIVNDAAYIGLGEGAPGNSYKDFYRFDGCCWAEATEFPGEERKGATGLAIGNKGYVGMGENAEGLALSDFYEFDASSPSGKWKKQTGLGSIGQIRSFSSGFEYGQRGFVGMGLAKVASLEYELSLFDFFEYFPQE